MIEYAVVSPFLEDCSPLKSMIKLLEKYVYSKKYMWNIKATIRGKVNNKLIKAIDATVFS